MIKEKFRKNLKNYLISSHNIFISFAFILVARILHYLRYFKAKKAARSKFRHEQKRAVRVKEITTPIIFKSRILFDVTYSTKCWENDWRRVLNSRFLEKNLRINNYAFSDRVVVINNISDNKEVINRAKELVRKGILTRYYLVDDYANEALSYFKIPKESFAGGYFYSISELVEIYLCKTKYLLHYAGDTLLQNKTNWINEGLLAIENENAKVVDPCCDAGFSHDRAAAIRETDKFFIGYGFSDRCYLIRTSDFKALIYNSTHPASNRYPEYGGESFEKRVDSWMQNNGWMRFTHKKAYYLHFNYFKNPFDRELDEKNKQ